MRDFDVGFGNAEHRGEIAPQREDPLAVRPHPVAATAKFRHGARRSERSVSDVRAAVFGAQRPETRCRRAFPFFADELVLGLEIEEVTRVTARKTAAAFPLRHAGEPA